MSPWEAPFLVLGFHDNLALVIFELELVIAVPCLDLQLRTILITSWEGLANLDIPSSFSVTMHDPLPAFFQFPVPDNFEKLNGDLPPLLELAVHWADPPLVVFAVPAVGEIVFGWLLDGANVVVLGGAGERDGARLVVVVNILVFVVRRAISEVELEIRLGGGGVLLVEIGCQWKPLSNVRDLTYAKVRRLIVLARLLAEVFVMARLGRAVDLELVRLVARFL